MLQTWIAFPCIILALRLLQFRRLQQLLNTFVETRRSRPVWQMDGPTDVARQGEPTVLQVQQFSGLVQRAIRHSPFPGNCLERSLTLWCLSRYWGMMSELRIGVRKEQNQILAHAWVEYQGQVLNDSATISNQFASFQQPIEPPTPER